MGTLLMPAHQPAGHDRGPCRQAETEGCQHGGGARDAAILPPCPVVNPEGLLRPIPVTESAARALADAQAAAPHQHTQGMIQRVHHRRQERADLVLRALRRQRATPPQDMARLDGIDRQGVVLTHERVKKVCEGLPPPGDRGRGQLGGVLVVEDGLNIPPRHLARFLGARRAKHAQIPAIMLDRVGRIGPRAPRRTAVADGNRFQASLPLRACRCVLCALACAYWCCLEVSESGAYRRVRGIE